MFRIVWISSTSVILCIAFSLQAKQKKKNLWGPDLPPIEAPSGKEESPNIANPELQSITQSVTSKSMQVTGETEGLFLIRVPKGKKVPFGKYILFIRPSQDGIDILAQGKVQGQQNNTLFVELLSKTVMKVPYKGDLAIEMSPPWTPKKENTEVELEPPLATEPPPPPGPPGFIQMDYGLFKGALATETNGNPANYYKNVPSFQFGNFHFEWFLDFLWRYGIEFDYFSGEFPTFSYYREAETTQQKVMTFKLNYRLRAFYNKKWRATFRLTSLSDEFSTTNPDEAVISTNYAGLGFGSRLAWEPHSKLWKPIKTSGWAISDVFVDLDLFPFFQAKDLSISRGTSSGSFAYNWKIGIQTVIYLKWMPWLKRWVLSGFYGAHNYLLKFSGPTTSQDVIGAKSIPENGRFTETTSYWMISLGLRFDDFIGKFFTPR